MDIRTAINDRPRLVVSIAAAVCLVAVLVLSWELFGSRRPAAETANLGKTFFSNDDGATWFIDDDSNLPPFDHNGKTAYRAAVYRCRTGKLFVAYLEKYTDAQLAKIAGEKKAYALRYPDRPPMPGVPYYPMDVKKPGESGWIHATAEGGHFDVAAYQRVTKLVGPDGSTEVSVVRPSDSDAH